MGKYNFILINNHRPLTPVFIPALQTSLSFVISLLSAVVIFSLMQIYKPFLVSSQALTIVAGVLGSWVFILSLTALSNLEQLVLGKGFQSRWGEVVICLLASCFACSTIHRVAVTTCILSSFIGLYYINKMSQSFHSAPIVVSDALNKKKKK
ncbi:unnamed protein product [Diamesa tonsa]